MSILFFNNSYGKVGPNYAVRVYESAFSGAHPTELVWQAGGTDADGHSWIKGARVADTDGDGSQEIVVDDSFMNADRLSVYENDGDDSYHAAHSEQLPGFIQVQSMTMLNDLDGDGRDEILIGGLPPDDSLLAYESTDDDTVMISWTWLFDPLISASFLVDAGDLDGDGKKEIVFATSGFSIYENQGFGWVEIWSGGGTTEGSISSIGAGDHDRHGKDEIIIRSPGPTGDVTAVYEIDPAYAADMDGDDTVDAIDNCPEQFNPGQEDVDADGVGDVCDNCLHGPNPTQGPAPLGQSIVATDPQTFSWPDAADVVFVKGDLAGVGGYVIDTMDSAALATGIVDSTVPAADSGFFYLVRPDCPVGSWQTATGAEPGRDAALP